MRSSDKPAITAAAAEDVASYRSAWSQFDNATGSTTPLGETTAARGQAGQAPGTLPAAAGTVIRVSVSAVAPVHASWATPIQAYFRRTADGWTLVGLERSAG